MTVSIEKEHSMQNLVEEIGPTMQPQQQTIKKDKNATRHIF